MSHDVYSYRELARRKREREKRRQDAEDNRIRHAAKAAEEQAHLDSITALLRASTADIRPARKDPT